MSHRGFKIALAILIVMGLWSKTTFALGTCEYVNQLASDATLLAEYEKVVEDAKTTGRKLPFSRNRSLDSASIYCLSCHDGATASDVSVTIGKTNLSEHSHSIGISYKYASLGNNDFYKINQVPSDVLFVEGRVGCLSCHDVNPINKKTSHLSQGNDGSALCLSCHNK